MAIIYIYIRTILRLSTLERLGTSSPKCVTYSKKGAAYAKKMTSLLKTSHARPRWFNVNVPMLIQLYTLFPSFNIRQKYITGNHMLTSPHIFLGLISPKFVSDLYGLIRRILYLNFGPYCIFTVPLVKHCVIKNGPVYGVSYLYAACLLIMTSSPTL